MLHIYGSAKLPPAGSYRSHPTSRRRHLDLGMTTPRPGVPQNTGDRGFCMEKQVVPPPPGASRDGVGRPRLSPCGGESSIKVFAPRMTPFLH
eukprot:1150896-Pelagomonas_calceolata.AAC.2